MTWEGGCQCGAVRYRISADPVVAYTCHCTHCRQQSSSAFGISVWFNREQFRLLEGNLEFWSTRADSGNTKLCAFCGKCGSRIYHVQSHDDQMLSIKGGSLDRIDEITPVAHLWTRSALSWTDPESGAIPCFREEPDSFEALIEKFQTAIEG